MIGMVIMSVANRISLVHLRFSDVCFIMARQMQSADVMVVSLLVVETVVLVDYARLSHARSQTTRGLCRIGGCSVVLKYRGTVYRYR